MSTAGPQAVPLAEAARRLAGSHAASARGAPRWGVRARLRLLQRTLDGALPVLAASPPPEPGAGAAEWLLDNAYLLAEALAQVRETLTPGFLRHLPALAAPSAGEPRIHAVARELVRDGDGHFDPDRAKRFLDAYDPVPPVTMGELWALPAMLRLVLLEELVDAADHLCATASGRSPPLAAGVDPVRTGRAVQSLRVLANLNWADFFEEASRVHRVLGRDPADVYARMDFETRDRYRKAVERVSRRSGTSEEEVAAAAVRLARGGGADPRRGHVGHWLVDRGRPELEAGTGYRRGSRERLRSVLSGTGPALYLLLVAVLTAAFVVVIAAPALRSGAGPWVVAGVLALCLVPASTLAVTLVNWAATHLFPPRVLPKLDFDGGVPADCRTAVVVPALLADDDEVAGLLAQLELNYRGNADPGLVFALLTDFTDAPGREMPGGAALLARAAEEIRELNRRLGSGGPPPFLLLHRERAWNPGEGCWMGWERKRGKLDDFNRWVLGLPSALEVRAGSADALAGVRFAITLDADTFLPQGAARRLVATLAHPLNRPVLGAGGEVAAGYSVLQPRVEVLPTSAARTPFARIFEGESGLDLYTRAVSDVYQDLFGEGSFAGKGIYDVAAFHASLAGRVPENALLSHDLFEGVHGRAALVSDIVVFEEYPGHVLTYVRRLHRWVRGDWQLLPWLLPRVPAGGGGRVPSRLTLLDRWKIADNLRRSLLSLSLVALLAAGWTVLPGPAGWWTAAALVVLGAPTLFGAAAMGRRWMQLRLRHFISIRRSREVGWAAVRWGVVVVLLPFEAVVEGDAVLRTLGRLLVTRRHLLEWTSAAHTARALRAGGARPAVWLRMAPAPLAALALAALVWAVRPGALPLAAPFLLAWLLSPEISFRLSRPGADPRPGLRSGDAPFLRALARRTWAFFDRFTGPDDHWLPPDHYQEDPPGVLARRTSPTNVGMMALSTLAAHDLGYVPVSRLAARLDNTLDTLAEVERYRGHVLNWYDTRTLAALEPRYVSTVDSGNLAGCLLVVAAACREAAVEPLVRQAAAAGLDDALRVLLDSLPAEPGAAAGALRGVVEELERVRAEVAAPGDARAWARLLVELGDRRLPGLEAAGISLVEAHPELFPPSVLAGMRTWLEQTSRQVAAHRSEVETLLPWLLLPDEPPPELGGARGDPGVEAAWRALREMGSAAPPLAEVADACASLRGGVEALERALRAAGEGGAAGLAWTGALSARIAGTAARGGELAAELASIAQRAEGMVAEMDFAFLYDPARRLFHIGYDVSAGRLDQSHYDLLASEARLASLLAVAKGDAPARHWLQLGRPLAKADGSAVLLSWSGSMFEYLLPALLTRTPRGSLLHLAAGAAVEQQRRFGRRHGVPWGISESSYAEVDAHGTYQYRAFGVPGLALRRDPGDRLVVAPYASALALGWSPREAAANLRSLAGLGMMGTYGLFEAVDYGPAARRPRREPVRVQSYMAHHQGMILVAVGNLLGGDAMVERFHSHPGISAAGLLLHEQVPGRARLEPRITARAAPAPLDVPPAVHAWRVAAGGVPPRAQLLANGSFSTLVTSWGSGGSRYRERAVTRWTADPALEPWGTWTYLKDLDTGALWSATAAPTHAPAEQYDVLFAPHVAEFHRREQQLSSRLAVAVAPGAPVEVRRLTLLNEGSRPRRLLVASCGEPALAPPAEDRRHPAFSKMFVESAFHPEASALLFRRRTATPLEETVRLGHAAVAGPSARLAGWETDRGRFLGRNGSARAPAALRAEPHGLSETQGTVLDPVFALAYEIDLAPGEEAEITFLTAAGATEAEVLANLDAYRTPGRVAWVFDESRARSEHELHELGVAPGDAETLQRALSALVYPFRGPAHGPPPVQALRPVHFQQTLWGLGMSGDNPVVVVQVSRAPETRPFLERVVRAHAALRRAGAVADLLVLDEEPVGYEQPLWDWLQVPLEQTGSIHWQSRPGGVFHVAADRLGPDARAAVLAGAHLVLDARRGMLESQLSGLGAPAARLPAFVPVPSAPLAAEPVARVERPTDLLFDNGFGGFAPDGREYVIHLEPGEHTPAPWINVVANPEFGFTVSEAGAGCTWSVNSGEHRLTPWNNDPVLDPPGEALYLRDEETGETWTPTPAPLPADVAYQVRHGAGYTRFLHASHGLDQELVLFVPRAEAAKVARMTLRNLWPRQRRLTLTYYAEWVLGSARRALSPHVVTELDPELGAVLARQDFTEEFGARVAFLASSERCHGATGDRGEFLGTPGNPARPAGLGRIGLAGAFGAGLDPCAALQVHVDLAPGEAKTLHFLLGDGATREEARERVRRLRDPAAVEAEWRAVSAFWEELLGRVQVRTPEPAMDVLLNRWLPYQALACRVWGRTALYQSSGAFGFRDQLQDALGFLLTAPELARRQLLEAAAHQFREGDVLHWWHPHSGRGVRTRCSDDLLWLPFVAAAYVEATGDAAVLDAAVPFLEGPVLAEGELERYDRYPPDPEGASLYEHCVRALAKGATRGRHGLPLIGTGDWNDAMNRVGPKGEGESVWLGWFLHAVLERFATCGEGRGDAARASLLRARAADLRASLETGGWDGAWYRRAYFDDGTPIGSAARPEGRIDSLTQSWAVLSGAADPDRARRAMDAVLDRLVREDDRLVLLLEPPFDRSIPSPGYIRAYPPGVRENGGQYTHAAVWVAWAAAALGDGDRAGALFRLLDPVLRVANREDAERYRVEPYVVAADVYGVGPHTGRGGWTWYTGSAAWLWRLGVEAILGLERKGDVLLVDPCIPRGWREYEMTYRFGRSAVHVRVENPDGVSEGVAAVQLDGATLPDLRIPLVDDGGEHHAVVRLGGPVPAVLTSPPAAAAVRA